METADEGCRVLGNEKPPDGVSGGGIRGSGRDGWERERGPGAAGYQPPPREIPPRGVIGLLLGAECGRLKRRLPVLLRCRGGEAHRFDCHR